MPGRNRFFLRTSQVLILGLCCAGFSARSTSAQTISTQAPAQTSAQTPGTPDAQPTAAAMQGDANASLSASSSASSSAQHHLLANSSVNLGPGDLVEIN